MTKTRSIGFLGTGIMGAHMARRLAQAGHSVRAWNRTRAKAVSLQALGVTVVDDVAQAGEGADLAIVMVADGPAADQVIFGKDGQGLLDVLKEGASLVVMSSIPMETAQAQAKAAAERRLIYLDAPVSGGERGAQDGTLVIMAGGEKSSFDNLLEVFAVFGRATLVGPAGTGSLAKLANQVIVANTICTVAEALLLVQKGGGDPHAVITALMGGFADSPILQFHGRRMVEGDFKPGGPCRIQLKDTSAAEALAAHLDLELPLTSLVKGVYASLVEHGQQELDHSAAFLELKRRNGLSEA